MASLVGLSITSDLSFTDGICLGEQQLSSEQIIIHPSPDGSIPRLEYSPLGACFEQELRLGNQMLQRSRQRLSDSGTGLDSIELDDITITRLQQSYFARVNPWFPILDQGLSWPEHLTKADAPRLQGECTSCALVLLALALGNLAEEGTQPSTDVEGLLAARLFDRALPLLNNTSFEADLDVILCHILATYEIAFSCTPVASRVLIFWQAILPLQP